MADELQNRLQALSDQYQQLQSDLQSSVQARQKLEAQQQENRSVRREFDALPDAAHDDGTGQVYKLVGPVLMKQERGEALLAVNSRLDYISGEIGRIEDKIRQTQEASEGKKVEIMQLQGQAQAGAQGAAA